MEYNSHNPPSHDMFTSGKNSSLFSAGSGANKVVVIIIAVVHFRKEVIAGVVKIHD